MGAAGNVYVSFATIWQLATNQLKPIIKSENSRNMHQSETISKLAKRSCNFHVPRPKLALATCPQTIGNCMFLVLSPLQIGRIGHIRFVLALIFDIYILFIDISLRFHNIDKYRYFISNPTYRKP